MIAIIGAMDEEVKAIYDRMEAVERLTIFDLEIIKGQLNKKEVILFKSGVGLTNAAISTSLVLSHYPIESVINIGTAGGIHKDVKVLDVIISSMVTYHDVDISVFGNPRSFSNENRFVYHADEKLVMLAQTILKENIHVGPMVSGHQFISMPQQITDIEHHYPEALCVDMEAAAIAHTSAYFKIPFIILRSISDHVKSDENKISFETYLLKASQRSAQFTFDFVEYI
jgi:adenosylhomocysteine nucleosidase